MADASFDASIGAVTHNGTDTYVDASLTVGGNSNRLLVAVYYSDNNAAPRLSGLSYQAGSGGAWELVGYAFIDTGAAPNRGFEVWVSKAPSTGSVTVRATVGVAIPTDGILGLISLYDVDQTTPYAGWQVSRYDVETQTITSVAGGLVLWFAHTATAPGSPTGATTAWDVDEVWNAYYRATHSAGDGASKTLNWGGIGIASAALNINGAAASGSTTISNLNLMS